MREQSKKQAHAYICAHWQPLSSDRNCYKGVLMNDTESVEPSEQAETQASPVHETVIDIEILEEDQTAEPEPQTEPEQGVKDEEKLPDVEQEKPIITVEEIEDPQAYPEIVEEPPEELVEQTATVEPIEAEDLEPEMTTSQVPVNPEEVPEAETVKEETVEEEKQEEVVEKSEVMVDTVHNFQVDVSPSTEKRASYEIDDHQEEVREDSSPEFVSFQSPRTDEETVDKDLENEMVVHDEPEVDQVQNNAEYHEVEKAVTPEPVASPIRVEEQPKEEPKKEMSEKPATGIKAPSARTTILPSKPKTAVPPKTTPSPTVSKRPTTSVPTVKIPAKTAPMSRPPAPFKATPAAPKQKAVPHRSHSQQRTPTSRNGSTTKMDSLPNTPKLVNRKYQNVQSRVGSITDHKPQGGNVEIFSEKKKYKAESKIGSLHNAEHKPGGGNVKIETAKLNFKDTAKPRVDAISNHTPKQSDKKITTQKLNWNAQSKIGSLENATHKAGGGQVKILNQRLEWAAASKVGSKDNIGHQPGGGNVQIFDEKLEYTAQPKVASIDQQARRGSDRSF